MSAPVDTAMVQSSRVCAPGSSANGWVKSPCSTVAPSSAKVSVPLTGSAVVLTTTAPMRARSPAVKKRGSTGRT